MHDAWKGQEENQHDWEDVDQWETPRVLFQVRCYHFVWFFYGCEISEDGLHKEPQDNNITEAVEPTLTPREVQRKALLQLSNENPEHNEVDDKEEDVQKPKKVVPRVIHLFSKRNIIPNHVHQHRDLKKREPS